MTVTQWILYAVVSLGSGVLGFIAGQLVQWNRHPGHFIAVTPTVRVNERSKRLGTMLLGLLAVVTVASSMLTSIEVRQESEARAEFAAEQRACWQHLSERLAQRIRITDSDHQNTTDFVEAVQEAMGSGGHEDTARAVVVAAAEYLERQEGLSEAKDETPMRVDACS